MPREKVNKVGRDIVHHDVNASFANDALREAEKLIMVETDSGEVIPLAEVIPEDRMKYIAKQNNWAARKLVFYIGLQERERDLVEKLSPFACKVFLFLKSQMYLNNKIKISVIEASKIMQMNKTTAYRAFQELVKHQVIVNVYRKNDPTWFLDPSVAFKGSFRYQKHLLDKFVQCLKHPGKPENQTETHGDSH